MRNRKNCGVETVTQHLLSPVQQWCGVAHQSLATTILMVELQSLLCHQIRSVVHGSLHEELILQVLFVEVTGDQGLERTPELVTHSEESTTLGSIAPLVKVASVEVCSNILQVQVQLSRSVSTINKNSHSKIMQLLNNVFDRKDQSRGRRYVVDDDEFDANISPAGLHQPTNLKYKDENYDDNDNLSTNSVSLLMGIVMSRLTMSHPALVTALSAALVQAL